VETVADAAAAPIAIRRRRQTLLGGFLLAIAAFWIAVPLRGPLLAASAATPHPDVPGQTPGLLLVRDEPPVSEQRAQEDRQAPSAPLNQVLDETRAMVEDLIEAKAADTELRHELQALKRDNERLSAELAQANTRRIELERSSQLAETRIAELTKAIDTALRDAARMDKELTWLRGQNGKLNHSLARADATRKATLAEVEKARAGLTRTREAATHAAAQSKADLAGLLKELDVKDQELAAAKSAREEDGGLVPGPDGDRYTVRSGETLWGIAQRHGVGLSALAQANGIGKPYRIYAGQKLRIPDGEAASTATGALRPHPPA
jgi:LysM repeat protein